MEALRKKEAKLTVQFTIVELLNERGDFAIASTSSITVSQSRGGGCASDSVNLGIVAVGAPSMFSLDSSGSPFLEVRIDDKANKEKGKKKSLSSVFRVSLAGVAKGSVREEKRVLASGTKIAYMWSPNIDSPWTLQELFSSRLRGSYPHLFVGETPYSGSFLPRKGTERVLLDRSNVSLKISGGEGLRGSLILTDLRLVFIPGFVDIQSLVDKTLGGKTERSVLEVAETFSSQRADWTLEHLTKYFKQVDTNGDGMVSADEMAAFLLSSTSQGSGFGIPLAQIAGISLPAKSKLGGEEAGGGGIGDEVLVFDEGDIEAHVVSFARVNNSAKSAYFGQHTVYHIEVSVQSRREEWTVVKRYSEFAALHAALLVEGASSLPPLPPKLSLTTAEPERRRTGLSEFLQAALALPAARSTTLASFLGGTNILAGIQEQRDEENEEEKTALEDPNRKLAQHILAETDRLQLSAIAGAEGGVGKHDGSSSRQAALRVVTKIGFSGVFFVEGGSINSAEPSIASQSAVDWCSMLIAEIRFLQAEADFPIVTGSAPIEPTEPTSLATVSSLALSPPPLQSSSLSQPPVYLSGGALMEAEYDRFGLRSEVSDSGEGTHRWRIVDNSSFTVCDTYPATFAVPAEADDSVLEESRKQRSKNRVPALTWLHPETGTPLCRSSQPLAGLKGVNEHKLKWGMLMSIRDSGAPGTSLKVVDARPKLNAQANALSGKGFEDVESMPGKRAGLEFMNIENIHAMRNSFALLTAACASEEDDFPELLAASKWLFHVKMVLRGALITAEAVDRKQPTLVHCSDGWDRTSQLCALAQLLLDPFYRTVVGFTRLIEKDFCSFGHMCSRRSNPATSEYSPVLLQFFDATYQVLRQFPSAFEFTETFLLACVDGFTSGWSLSFVADCERDRDASRKFADSTTSANSLWQILLHGRRASELSASSPFLNLSYEPSAALVHLLRPKVGMQAIVFWSALYLRHSPLL